MWGGPPVCSQLPETIVYPSDLRSSGVDSCSDWEVNTFENLVVQSSFGLRAASSSSFELKLAISLSN